MKVDSRDIHAGQKYLMGNQGVPLRLNRPRDIENDTAFAAKRTGGKELYHWQILLRNVKGYCRKYPMN